jgi:hypothetical protein
MPVILPIWEAEVGRKELSLRLATGKSERPYLTTKLKAKRTGVWLSEALSSILDTAKQTDKKVMLL